MYHVSSRLPPRIALSTPKFLPPPPGKGPHREGERHRGLRLPVRFSSPFGAIGAQSRPIPNSLQANSSTIALSPAKADDLEPRRVLGCRRHRPRRRRSAFCRDYSTTLSMPSSPPMAAYQVPSPIPPPGQEGIKQWPCMLAYRSTVDINLIPAGHSNTTGRGTTKQIYNCSEELPQKWVVQDVKIIVKMKNIYRRLIGL